VLPASPFRHSLSQSTGIAMLPILGHAGIPEQEKATPNPQHHAQDAFPASATVGWRMVE
jgi:hypothetical protein